MYYIFFVIFILGDISTLQTSVVPIPLVADVGRQVLIKVSFSALNRMDILQVCFIFIRVVLLFHVDLLVSTLSIYYFHFK